MCVPFPYVVVCIVLSGFIQDERCLFVIAVFSELRWEVIFRFFGFGGIDDDHHYLFFFS